jgi:hypothetical protein
MDLTITLQPEFEARFREEARHVGVTVEQLVAQRAIEAELLWKIRLATPETETRTLHHLLRKRKKGTLAAEEQSQLQALLDDREQRGTQRLEDLTHLARLRGVPVRQLMEQLDIHPIPAP